MDRGTLSELQTLFTTTAPRGEYCVVVAGTGTRGYAPEASEIDEEAENDPEHSPEDAET